MYRIVRILLLFPILCLLSCSTGRNVSRQLNKDFVKNEAERPWFSGLMFYEPASKKVIFEHHSNKYFNPASTAKLLSFYAGLKLLKDSIPGIKYTIKNDTLYFSGTGDPTFLHKDFDSSRILNFLKSAPQNLVLVSPVPAEEAFGPGWAWDDYNYRFSPERAPLPLYGNVVNFAFRPGKSLEVTPPFFQELLQMDSSVTAGRVHRLQKKNSFKFPVFETTAFQQQVPFITSEELTAKLLEDTLNRKVSVKTIPLKKAVFQKKLLSQPVDSLYKRMLQDSDNFFAEQLLLVAAGEISDTLRAKIAIEHMKQEYLKDMPQEVKWVDGSGLSRYNLITPQSMVWLLEKIYREIPEERLFELLPAGGVSGTLKNDYKAPPGKAPFVYAKTGTLSNNHSLGGYLITASGKVLIFSFMNSNYLVPTAVVKAEMDKVLRNLYLNY